MFEKLIALKPANKHNISHIWSHSAIRSHPVTSGHIRSHPVTSDHIRSHPITSDHIRSHPVTSGRSASLTHGSGIRMSIFWPDIRYWLDVTEHLVGSYPQYNYYFYLLAAVWKSVLNVIFEFMYIFVCFFSHPNANIIIKYIHSMYIIRTLRQVSYKL